MPTEAESTGAAYRRLILQADQEIASAVDQLDSGMEKRDQLILEALTHRVLTQQTIAEDLGVTQGRISQIVKRARRIQARASV